MILYVSVFNRIVVSELPSLVNLIGELFNSVVMGELFNSIRISC